MSALKQPKQLAPSLGLGVYGFAEIARYTQLHPSRVRSWFRERSDGRGQGPVFAGDYRSIRRHHAFSFHDLIDALVAGRLRDQNVTMAVVRKAFASLQKKLRTPHPFCHNNLYTDGKKIFILTAQELEDKTLREVVSDQQFFMHILEYLEHIDYDTTSRLASRWRIADGVVLDPRVSLGKPVVADTGTTTYVVANTYKANNNDAELVGELFDITESDVLNAVEFERHFDTQRAA